MRILHIWQRDVIASLLNCLGIFKALLILKIRILANFGGNSSIHSMEFK